MANIVISSGLQNNLERLRHARWRGRTDTIWLAREILGYKDIEEDVHRPIINVLQHFPAPPQPDWNVYDVVTPKAIQYIKPYVPLERLPGGRRRLILDPRGFFKTTINVMVHSIQWILNYPDITILIIHGKQEVAEDILTEIKGHFLTNRVFREIYPDYCMEPKDAGNSLKLIVPNRRRVHREPTIGVSSINTVVAGYHYDVMKFTDIVNEVNSGNKEQLQKVISSFGMYRNVLVSPDRWIDVEGTCYDYGDLYNRTIENELKLAADERQWRIHVRGCYKKDTGGNPYTFLPEERELKDLLDQNGQKISWFPNRFPTHLLEQMRKDPTQSEFLFAAQQLNNPVDTSDAKPFPANLLRTKTRDELRKVPMSYYTTTVDTAETDNEASDYSAIVTCGWDGFGRCYVVDTRHGRMLPDELIRTIFDVYRKWHPVSIAIEETGYVRGLKTSIRRYEDLSQVYLPFLFTPRDNQRSKIERILNTLQPWFRREEIVFDETLSAFEHFRKELTSFPKGRTDDLIDALADQFQFREWAGREISRPETPEQYKTYVKSAMDRAMERKTLGIGEYAMPEAAPITNRGFFDSTGGL